MPEVSRFYGIIVRIFYDDHLPGRALGMVTEWASLHQRELLASWERASRLELPGKIAPLP